MKSLKTALATAILTGMAGCANNGPDSADIEKAWHLMSGTVASTAAGFHSFRVRRCDTVARNDVFNCEFSYMRISRTEIATARFTRHHNGWSMSDLTPLSSYNTAR